MIILLLNLEVVVLIYFRDTGCFINYYIIIIDIIVTSSYSATYMYVYIYICIHIPFSCRVNNPSKSCVLIRKSYIYDMLMLHTF